MTDVRRNKPSASGIERLSLCPGSWNLCQSLPSEKAPESEAAASGTRIHAALAGDPVECLTEQELETVAACQRIEAEAIELVFPGSPKSLMLMEREKRLWFADRFSGQFDLCVTSENEAIVLDYKSGRGEVEIAEGNFQLRSLAVLVKQHNPSLNSVTVGIVQPWASPQLSLCRYAGLDLIRAELWLLDTLQNAESENPELRRIPGEKQCKYCRAKAHCPEARNTALTTFEAPEQSVALLTPDELGDYLGRIALVETVIDALKAEAKSRLEKGEQVTGWRLKPGADKSTITDPQMLFNRFSARGGTVPQFMRAITVAKGKFKEVFKEVTQIKGKDLDKAVESMMDGIVETKTSAPSLERVKD